MLVGARGVVHMPQFNGKQEEGVARSTHSNLRCPRNGQADEPLGSASVTQATGRLEQAPGKATEVVSASPDTGQQGDLPQGRLYDPSTVGEGGEGVYLLVFLMKKSFAVRARVVAPALSLVGLACASVLAQTQEVNPVVISASRMPQPQSQASVVVDVISRQQIEQSGASNISEFLDSVPGMSVNRLYGRAGVDASVDVGYLGQSGSQNVLILIDGQRVNGADSSGSKFALLPMSAIQQIEIRKANGGVLFGDRAQGGVVNIITRNDASKSVNLSLGSYGYQKQDAYVGFQSDQLRGSVSLMNAKSDGYREFSESDQRSAQLRLVHGSDLGKLSFFLRAFDEDANLPSYLTRSQFESNPKRIGAYPIATQRSGTATGLKYERALEGNDLFSIDAYRQELKDKTYNTITNTRTSINPEYKTALGNGQLILGGEWADMQANTDLGKQVKQQTQSVFAQTIHPLTSTLSVDAGLRSQNADNSFQTGSGAVSTSANARKTGASVGLFAKLSDTASLRTGALTGFRFPNADELYSFNRQTYALLEINPSVSPMSTKEFFLQYEQRHNAGQFSAHYRRIEATGEIAYQYDCGVVGGVNASCNSNLYDTKRSVLSLSSYWRISPDSSFKGSVDFVDASLSTGTYAGKRIPLTPQQVVRLSYEKKVHHYTWMSSANYRNNMVQASDQGELNPKIPSRTIFDLGVRRQFSQDVSASLWVRNVMNKSYYDYATYNGVYPADGRSVFANVKVSF
jgi:iron complex outermembrane receptor protein